ncbi:MAG: zf-TFIIB domain-containing protein [Phycisphaerae bacterium]|nr:zf-TFIIB domain-containing protein [Phycisphaerae bacterium]
MVAGGVTVDVCKGGCGGVWFDNFELQKVDNASESAGGLLDVERDENVAVDHSARKKCPKCDDLVMMRHFSGVKKEVEVDECPGCGGFWLDFGELAQIRSQFATEAEKDQATSVYFTEAFGEELDKMAAESQATLDKATKFALMFRHICPSYHIPGDQRWGAF